MMDRRYMLQATLEMLDGIAAVYYQPPSSLRLEFPCVMYSLSGQDTKKADGSMYRLRNIYDIVIVTRNPDNTFTKDIYDLLDYVSFSTHYVKNDLYHYVYRCYF